MQAALLEPDALKPFEVEVETEEEEAQYTAWLRAKVQEAIDDPGPDIPHEVVMAEMYAIIERAEARQQQATS